MRLPVVGLLGFVVILVGVSSKGQTTRSAPFNPRWTYGVSVEGSWGSPNIISGLLHDQMVVATSVDIDRALHQGKRARYRWELEVLPLYMLGDLRLQDFNTLNIPGQTPIIQNYDGLVAYPCMDRAPYTGPYYVIVNGVAVPDGTITTSQVCTRKWTYGGGVSPLGQRFNFLPGRRVQPYVEVNAGFVLFTEAVPISDGVRFNFTAEAGAGAEIFRSAKQSLTFDVRYHHLSNAGRGQENPGVENWMLRVGYRFGR